MSDPRQAAATYHASQPQSRGTLESRGTRESRWVLVIHGGAGAENPPDPPRREKLLAGLAHALQAGSERLQAGQPALDAVEAAVRVLEDDPVFNAGRGAKMTLDGSFELDAAIMCGQTRAAGAVAGVRTIANPVSLARAVMERTPHVMLAGSGAETFARSIGIAEVEPSYFFDEHEYRVNNEYRLQQGLPPLPHPARLPSLGTVGAVALDVQGNLAAATSTGGVTGKLQGRIGDTPVIGAGTYALNGIGAISCTGRGEEFIRHAAAFQAILRTRLQSLSLEQSVAQVLHGELPANCGGMIGVSAAGEIVMDFSTKWMNRGFATSQGEWQTWIERQA